MKAIEARIRNFRSIDDSGWVPLDRVTAFVGRNESGKTSLLKALHKFNPSTKEPYDPQREFPRDRLKRDYKADKEFPVSTVRFEFSPEERDTVAEIVGGDAPTHAVCTRYYSGKLTVEVEPSIVEAPLSDQGLAAKVKAFAKKARRIAREEGQTEEQVASIRDGLSEWASNWQDTLPDGEGLRTQEGLDVLVRLKKEAGQRTHPAIVDDAEEISEVAAAVLAEAKKPLASVRLAEFVQGRLPVFIYFENYGILDSAVYLPRFMEDLSHTPNDPRVRTISAMFRHVNIDPKELTSQGNEVRRNGNAPSEADIAREQSLKERRAIELNSASLDITQRFSEWWHQRRHNIEYDADGSYFRIWVSDERRPGVKIELEARSKGFQWFFSFYLVFLVESDDGHKDAVLLLDEPALHLHPTAQQEMIRFFETLSEKNQLIYSTHSPFLIDPQHLSRVRAVVEKADGRSEVSVGHWPSDQETIFPLQAAAGYAMAEDLLKQQKSLLVEGMTDHYYLHTLSSACRLAGKERLADGAYVVPCSGTKSVSYMASLFLARQSRPLILLDGDKAGSSERSALLRDLYTGHDDSIIVVDRAVGFEGAQVEDLIGDEIVLAALERACGVTLDLKEGGSITERIKTAAKAADIVLPSDWKGLTALEIARGQLEGRYIFSPESLEKASSFFSEINRRLGLVEDQSGNTGEQPHLKLVS